MLCLTTLPPIPPLRLPPPAPFYTVAQPVPEPVPAASKDVFAPAICPQPAAPVQPCHSQPLAPASPAPNLMRLTREQALRNYQCLCERLILSLTLVSHDLFAHHYANALSRGELAHAQATSWGNTGVPGRPAAIYIYLQRYLQACRQEACYPPESPEVLLVVLALLAGKFDERTYVQAKPYSLILERLGVEQRSLLEIEAAVLKRLNWRVWLHDKDVAHAYELIRQRAPAQRPWLGQILKLETNHHNLLVGLGKTFTQEAYSRLRASSG